MSHTYFVIFHKFTKFRYVFDGNSLFHYFFYF